MLGNPANKAVYKSTNGRNHTFRETVMLRKTTLQKLQSLVTDPRSSMKNINRFGVVVALNGKNMVLADNSSEGHIPIWLAKIPGFARKQKNTDTCV